MSRQLTFQATRAHRDMPSPYAAVHYERARAHAKHDTGGGSMERKPWNDPIWLAVLTEEVGEVARVLCETRLGNEDFPRTRLREELVQVAAMACAWIDAIDDSTEVIDPVTGRRLCPSCGDEWAFCGGRHGGDAS